MEGGGWWLVVVTGLGSVVRKAANKAWAMRRLRLPLALRLHLRLRL